MCWLTKSHSDEVLATNNLLFYFNEDKEILQNSLEREYAFRFQ